MLKGKTILLGVTGSIAAYKIAYLASALVKAGAKVHVLMTQNATNFINPITFETLTGNKCLIDTFDRNFQFSVEHVSLAKEADVFMVAPASANVIGKLAHGIADDMLTTTFMACTCPKIISPAMNTRMYENPITQDNLKILEHYGMEVIRPASGYLACGDTGAGKMPEPETLFEYILRTVGYPKDMVGKKVLITAGPTREAIDPVRYITNHSTGKMGYAIAKAAAYRGAEVTLVTGPVAIKPPMFVKVVTFFVKRSYTPLKFFPQPMGQFTGQVRIPNTSSISSNSSYGSLASRSNLLINVKIGIWRITQTLNSLMVCASTPLDPSMTMTAESAAIRVR